MNLYFIAIMLPQSADEEIIVFKNEIAQRFHSKKALRTASHITLKAPFKMPAEMHVQLLQWFEQMNIGVAPFLQEIKDFGAFHNKHNPVIYISPVMNEALSQLQKAVLDEFIAAFPWQNVSKHEHTFSPHITIAYRDLYPHQFKEAWKEFATRQFHAFFEVNSFQLLQHINSSWNVIDNFLLSR